MVHRECSRVKAKAVCRNLQRSREPVSWRAVTQQQQACAGQAIGSYVTQGDHHGMVVELLKVEGCRHAGLQVRSSTSSSSLLQVGGPTGGGHDQQQQQQPVVTHRPMMRKGCASQSMASMTCALSFRRAVRVE